MTWQLAEPGDSSSPDAPEGQAGYVSSLTPRPHALTPPTSRPSRWEEIRASLAWVASSWLRPGDTDAL